MLLLFGVNCLVWTHSKIDYVFLFEFDPRHHLDYRQFLELPALLSLIGCICFWLSFNNFSLQQLSPTWYPIIFFCICCAILILPFKVLHRSSRYWFAISIVQCSNDFLIWQLRVIFSGLFPVEYRDFFVGDEFNSLFYSIGNFALFFCLISQDWSSPAQCNSSHSRIFGFFFTLPGVWRFLQCIRRYYDTRRSFPHLVNAGKYTATILMNMTLSLWRIEESITNEALFITFATINSLYCCISPNIR